MCKVSLNFKLATICLEDYVDSIIIDSFCTGFIQPSRNAEENTTVKNSFVPWVSAGTAGAWGGGVLQGDALTSSLDLKMMTS